VSVENNDEIFVRVVGNLITDPILRDDGKGNKICLCKLASNPPAKRFNPRTNEPISDKERNKTRTIIQLVFTRTGEAERFMESYQAGDRLEITGDGITKEVPKMCYSHKEKKWIPCIVDVDGDKQHIEHIMEGRMTITVSRCIPIFRNSENNTQYMSQ
jgi:hypothetical protein